MAVSYPVGQGRYRTFSLSWNVLQDMLLYVKCNLTLHFTSSDLKSFLAIFNELIKYFYCLIVPSREIFHLINDFSLNFIHSIYAMYPVYFFLHKILYQEDIHRYTKY